MKTFIPHSKTTAALLLCQMLLCLPAVAQAYIGPGAGLSLLGALWALLVAMGAALVFVCAWPIRRLLRRLRGDKANGETMVVESEVVALNTETATPETTAQPTSGRKESY